MSEQQDISQYQTLEYLGTPESPVIWGTRDVLPKPVVKQLAEDGGFRPIREIWNKDSRPPEVDIGKKLEILWNNGQIGCFTVTQMSAGGGVDANYLVGKDETGMHYGEEISLGMGVNKDHHRRFWRPVQQFYFQQQ